MSVETSLPVVFTTQTAYPLPSQKFMIPASWRRYQLSQLVNKALSLAKPIPFDFLIQGEIIRSSIGEWCAEKGVGEEETLQIEYIESIMPPQRLSSLPHEDWVSSVTCAIPGHFLTASYDGSLRAFGHSQQQLASASLHSGPATSICVVPTPTAHADTHLVASASHDLTGKLSRLTLAEDRQSATLTTFASLQLHTAPLSSIAAAAGGDHLLTASWDALIGVWDAAIPAHDEVPLETDGASERKKRRKMVDGAQQQQSKRKAPLAVLKSHTARVSKALFVPGSAQKAVSCGMDSTVRTWDVENGVCTHTITVSEKPFLDVALSADGTTALAAATDRTVTLHDLRASATTAVAGTFAHPATPSCVVVSPAAGTHQLATGAYDGLVRVWDLRSTSAAVASFRPAWEAGAAKVLALDWYADVIAVGGEGGLEVWKAGEGSA